LRIVVPLSILSHSHTRPGSFAFAKVNVVIPESFRYIAKVVRSFAAFLFGLIIGVVGMLLLPELTARREQLQGQVRDLSDQLKKMTQPKPGDDQPKQASPSPSPH
jgi:hypothetical protein